MAGQAQIRILIRPDSKQGSRKNNRKVRLDTLSPAGAQWRHGHDWPHWMCLESWSWLDGRAQAHPCATTCDQKPLGTGYCPRLPRLVASGSGDPKGLRPVRSLQTQHCTVAPKIFCVPKVAIAPYSRWPHTFLFQHTPMRLAEFQPSCFPSQKRQPYVTYLLAARTLYLLKQWESVEKQLWTPLTPYAKMIARVSRIADSRLHLAVNH